MSRENFDWRDPFLLEEQLNAGECRLRDSEQGNCQGRLLPRVRDLRELIPGRAQTGLAAFAG